MPKLKGGRSNPTDFAESMAAAIEDQLNKLLAEDGKQTLPADGTTDQARDRRRFIAAIARGVILYLTQNPDAFEVVFTSVPATLSASDFAANVQVLGSDVP
jgi:hypothetical protein